MLGPMSERPGVAELEAENRQLEERVRALEESNRTLRAELDRLLQVTDAVPSLLAYTDREERYRYVNSAYERWFGIPRDELLGRTLREVVGDDAYASLEEPVHRALAGEAQRWEAYLPYRLGGGRYVHVDYVPHRDAQGQVHGYCALVHDMTDRKRTEEALEDAARRKDAFLATLAHELRNPLAPLRTGVELLARLADAPEKLEKLQAAMRRQVDQLVFLVDDLLDVSRITSGKITLDRRRLCLADVAAQALETVKPALVAASQRYTVDVPKDLHVFGDPHRIAQIFTNLLSNASKFTQAGGSIRLRASSEGDFVRILVEDDGQGIEAHMLERIFARFSQAEHPLERGRGGLGLGLTLARLLAEMHGGSVRAESDGLGRGSRFIVRLPSVPHETESTSAIPASHRDIPTHGRGLPARVLVVDDNEDAAHTLRLLLEEEGHRVETAHDGPSALSAALRLQPDVVLLDLGLPEMDGLEVARRLRARSPERQPLLVALTGWGQEKDKARTRSAGFDLHVTKPVEPRRICAVVAGAMRATADAPAV